MRNINTLIVHCAYTPPSMDIGVDEIRKWHLNRGWDDVGYHFVIRRDGTIETGRSMNKPGAHAKGHNLNSIGVCLVGGMSEDSQQSECNYTKAQWRALEELCDAMIEVHSIGSIIGHNQVSQKPCPCFNVAEWWAY